MLKLFNTLSRKIEEFNPIDPSKVGLYTCGPTVYDFAHIGNLRTYLFEDLLQRVLEANGFTVERVMNITDIEDKIINKAKQENLPIAEITKPYEVAFMEDLEKLNMRLANVYPKATEHIQKMVKYIESLIKKGFAYVEDDGSVYFAISKFTDYGKLSGLENRTLKTGTRVLSDEYEKENAQDFALWKSADPSEVGFDSPWGYGRPGWHIECSVMSQEYLGDTFDIHTGGVDNIFPHHENEIAQAESLTGKKFANYFLHGEHLLVDGKKMAKSAQNFFTLRGIESKSIEPMAFRYLILTAHYRDKLNFSWESLGSASNALNNIKSEIRAWDSPKQVDEAFWQKFLEAANNDLNLPQALAIFWEMLKSNLPTETKSATLLKMDEVLGLGLEKFVSKPLDLNIKIEELVKVQDKLQILKELDYVLPNKTSGATISTMKDVRDLARSEGDYDKADKVRDIMEDLGYVMEDTVAGTAVKKK